MRRFQFVMWTSVGLAHGLATVRKVHGGGHSISQVGAPNVAVGHRGVYVAHGRREGGVVQQHPSGRVRAVAHPVGVGVAVVVQGVVVAEGVGHGAGISWARKA